MLILILRKEIQMRLTNKFNVPPVIVAAIQADIDHDPYSSLKTDANKNDVFFRTTELLGPPLITTLKNKFKDSDEMVVDATHYLAVQYGKMFHKMCEGVSTEDLLYEYKVSRTFDYKGQLVTVFGTLDELEFVNDLLLFTDNKTCLMSNLGYEKPEYDEQVNTYLHLARPVLGAGFKNVQMQLRYFIKDFTPSKKVNALARAANTYTKAKANELPDSSIIYKNVPVYDEADIDRIIMGHIGDHLETPDRICTDKERWDTLPKVAVMLTGNKTAKKVCNSKSEAQQFITTLKSKDQERAFLEDRIPGAHERDKRCQYYCEVASVCPFAKSKGYR